MTMRLGTGSNQTPCLFWKAWAMMPRVRPRGSQVTKGSLVAARVTADWDLFNLKRASPAGVRGGITGRTVFSGPIQAPVRSRLGAGPGGLGILGTPLAIMLGLAPRAPKAPRPGAGAAF